MHAGATVWLECQDPQERHLTYSLEGQTEASTIYSLEVEGDHEDEICEDVLVKSNEPDLVRFLNKGWRKPAQELALPPTMASLVRFAAPIVYKELNILPEELSWRGKATWNGWNVKLEPHFLLIPNHFSLSWSWH